MKAWLLESFGGIDKLNLTETADPQPAQGEAVVKLLFAGLNPADRYLSEGMYPARPPLPHILGRDGIGIIESLGPSPGSGDGGAMSGTDAISNQTPGLRYRALAQRVLQDPDPPTVNLKPHQHPMPVNFKVGEKVSIVRSEIGVTRAGTFAQRVAVPTESLVRPPAGWTDEQAAGATLVYLTAYQAITQWPDLGSSERPAKCVTLITGATGGVGVAATQLAKALGHTIIGLSRSAEKSEKLREIGAHAMFNPEDSQWRRKLKEFLKDARVDLAIDNIAGPLFNELLDTLAYNGRVSCVGRLAGPVPEFNTASLFFRRLQIRGVAVGTYSPAESTRVWNQIVNLLNQINARPLVDSVFDFDKLPDAFERLQRGPMGKVLIHVS